jgi:hypothetical protein
VAKSVDDGFTEGFAVDLGDIDSGQAIEFHGGWGAQKRYPILVFSVHATLTKTLPNNPKIRRSLPKVGGSMKVAK